MGEDGGSSTLNHATDIAFTHRGNQWRQYHQLIIWGHREWTRCPKPPPTSPEQFFASCSYQPTGYIKIVVLPLRKIETHIRDVLQKIRIFRVVGRKTKDENISVSSENGGEGGRRGTAAAEFDRKPWGNGRTGDHDTPGGSSRWRQCARSREFC